MRNPKEHVRNTRKSPSEGKKRKQMIQLKKRKKINRHRSWHRSWHRSRHRSWRRSRRRSRRRSWRAPLEKEFGDSAAELVAT